MESIKTGWAGGKPEFIAESLATSASDLYPLA
jgi:hypothetical protein